MKMMTWNPNRMACRSPRYHQNPVFGNMDRLFEEFFVPTNSQDCDSASCWSPLVDVREEGNGYLVEADLPGLTKEDIAITMEDNVLSINGERKVESEQSDKRIYRRERLNGKFSRALSFPNDVQTDSISAVFKDGVLRIQIPKTEAKKPRQIEIN